jgi:hypothetical protein
VPRGSVGGVADSANERLDVRAAYTTFPVFRHGTVNGYGNHNCRCAKCRRAHAEAIRERYAVYAAEGGRGEHGTYYRYKTGCRCEACRAASAAYSREYKRRRRSAS